MMFLNLLWPAISLSRQFALALRGRLRFGQPLRVSCAWGDKAAMQIDHGERSLSVTFMALLIEDVIAARGRLNGSHSETARRDVVRASVAAMEGSTWVARKHVRSALADVGRLTSLAELAFRETSYSVSDTGRLRSGCKPCHC